jgi:hypothetical protein
MQNDTEKTLTEKEFKKAWEELEAEYENELQRLHAEIEQEEKQNAEKNQVQ